MSALCLGLALAGCGKGGETATDADIQRGIDRSVADIRAADAAAAQEAALSRSVGELTAKAPAAAPAKAEPREQAPAEAG